MEIVVVVVFFALIFLVALGIDLFELWFSRFAQKEIAYSSRKKGG